MDGLIQGKIVHYVDGAGLELPAMIVRTLDRDEGLVVLRVFDDISTLSDYIVTSVFASSEIKHTWHWIENS